MLSDGLRLRVRWALLALAAVAAILTAAEPASAASCSGSRFGRYIALDPASGQLPLGAPATLRARVGPVAGADATPGHLVSFRVVCGPDTGQAVTRTTGAHTVSYPRLPWAGFTVHNHGHPGVDVITATTRFDGQQSTATSSVQWVSPVRTCDAPLGFFAAFACSKAYRLGHTVLELGECSYTVSSFLAFPELKFAELLKTASSVAAAESEAKRLSAGSSIVHLAVDLRSLGRDGVSFARLRAAFADARDAKTLLANLWGLLHAIPSGDINMVALDIANLTGLDSCVSLLADTLSSPAPVPVPPVAPPPPPAMTEVSLDTLCGGATMIDAQNGCPYDGTAAVGEAPFDYSVLIENNNDSLSPSYWDLIDFPATTCRSITFHFAIPDNGGQSGDVASIGVVDGSHPAQTAAVEYGQVGTLTATLDGQPWSLENSATNTSDQIALTATALCRSASGY